MATAIDLQIRISSDVDDIASQPETIVTFLDRTALVGFLQPYLGTVNVSG